ncbi:hypothetical protein [Butyrivibrio sp. VCB2006]|uniref:hypothetical protein n=1 Tax=Butyrivibrio sp. VCB2006 TaxID=1280679 RepID=UPI0004128B18|nr:hypothetical protein [Butyrivibrio sp. VCB2006]
MAATLAAGIIGCGSTSATSFAYPSLDVHKEYYGWYTSIYGFSEALFKMDENMSAASCLAKDATADGSVWTITLNDGVAFSNGNALTADKVSLFMSGNTL